MTSDENILEEMIERYTNPKSLEPDNYAMEMFLLVVKSNGSLVTKAHDLIVKKMRSPNVLEANRAIGLLEECMSRAGTEFQNKTAKFLFLNELIALVLDKHDDLRAPNETKQRIMECLMLWSAKHTDKIKIQKAYENLKTQVHFITAPSDILAATSSSSSMKTPQRASILGKDDQLFAKLLKEGGEENYKRANLVIQRNFNQEARRTEFICHLKSEIKNITNTMELLSDMLNSYSSDAPGADSRDIIYELYNRCSKQNEQMARWPDFLGDTEPEFLDDVLTTKDQLVVILQTYKDLFETTTENPKIPETKPIDPLLPTQECKTSPQTIAEPSARNTMYADLLSDLLGDNDVKMSTKSNSCLDENKVENYEVPEAAAETTQSIDELFGSLEISSEKTNYSSDLFKNIDLLEPTSVFCMEHPKSPEEKDSEIANTNGNHEENIVKPLGFKELREIDKLSEEIFQKTLQSKSRQATFKKEPEKITLNDLAKDKMQTSLKPQNSGINPIESDKITKENINNLDIFKEKPLPVKEERDEEEKCSENSLHQLKEEEKGKSIEVEVKENLSMVKSNSSLPFQPLAEIDIDLDEVTPLPEDPRLIFADDDIQVTLNFTEDRPSAHVSVIVVSVTNKSKLPVREFQFEASVKKPCKVRLLPPTDTEMAPSKPFRPSASINQVVLVLNTTEKPVDLTCVVGYKLGDDPDPIKEPIVAKDIPYV